MEEQLSLISEIEMEKMVVKGFSIVEERNKFDPIIDIEFLQAQLFRALGVPKEYLGTKAR